MRVKKDQNCSSFPKGDEDLNRNRERMSSTTSSCYTDMGAELPVRPGEGLRTRSCVDFGRVDCDFSTTSSSHYSAKRTARLQPVRHQHCNILGGHGEGGATVREGPR
ncbi:unnamed protein product [Knipowitschia caucasica]